MTLVRLNPQEMATAGLRVHSEVVTGLVETSMSLSAGMPWNLRPDLAVRVRMLQARGTSEAFGRTAELGNQLVGRSGLILVADSGAFDAATRVFDVATGALFWTGKGYLKSPLWKAIGFKPGRGGYPTLNPKLAKIFGSPQSITKFLNSGVMSKLGAVGTGFSVLDSFGSSTESDPQMRALDAVGGGFGSSVPVSPHMEVVAGAANDFVLVKKMTVGLSTGDMTDAEAHVDKMASGERGIVQWAIGNVAKTGGDALADVGWKATAHVGSWLNPDSDYWENAKHT